MPELLPILLVLTPLLGALATLLPALRAEVRGIRVGVALLLLLFAGLLVARIVATGGGSALRHTVLVDALSGVALLVVVPCGAVALLVAPASSPLADAGMAMRSHRYYALVHVAICCLLLGCLGSNLALVWAGNAMAILPLAGLSGSSGRGAARGAAARYAACAVVAAALALAGLAALALAARGPLGDSFAALDWPALHRQASTLDPALTRIALVLTLGGFGALAGLIPFQGWLTKGTLQVPRPAQALALAGSSGAALAALLRVYSISTGTLGRDLPAHLLLALGLAGVIAISPALWCAGRLIEAATFATLAGAGMAAAAVAIGGVGVPAGALLGLLGRPPALALIAMVDGGARGGPGPRERARGALLIGGLLALASGPLSLGALGTYRSVETAADRTMPAAAVLLLGAIGIAAAVGRQAMPTLRAPLRPVIGADQSPSEERRMEGADPSMLGPGLLLAALLIVGISPPSGLVSLVTRAAALLYSG